MPQAPVDHADQTTLPACADCACCYTGWPLRLTEVVCCVAEAM